MSVVEGIAQARADGLSDTEIWSYLRSTPEAKAALKDGLSERELFEGLGLAKAIPGPFGMEYERVGKRYDLDPRVLAAQGLHESGWNPKAKGPQIGLARPGEEPEHALGLAQLTPATARALKVDPLDPAAAIDAQGRLMREGLDRNGGDLDLALREYHGGPNRAIWGKQTAAYPDLVLGAKNKLFGTEGDQPEGPKWNQFLQAANGFLKGAGVPVAAAGAALRAGFENWQNGMSVPDAMELSIKSIYPQAKAALGEAKTKTESESPLGSALSSLAGDTASTVMGLRALAPGGLLPVSTAPGALARGAALFGEGAAQGGLAAAVSEPGREGFEQLVQRASGRAPLDSPTAVGALAGGVVNSTLGPAVSKLWESTFGSNIHPQTAKVASELIENKLPIRQGQFAAPEGAPAARLAEAVFPPHGTGDIGQFTENLAQRVGVRGDRLTGGPRGNVEPAMRGAGQELDSIAAGKLISPYDQTLGRALQIMATELGQDAGLTAEQKAPLLKEFHRLYEANYGQVVNTRHGVAITPAKGLSGEEFRDLTESGSLFTSKALGNNPKLARAAAELRTELQKAFYRNVTPEEMTQYQGALARYRLLNKINSVTEPTGLVDPRKLASAMEARGWDVGDFGKVGDMVGAAGKYFPSLGEAEAGAKVPSVRLHAGGVGLLGLAGAGALSLPHIPLTESDNPLYSPKGTATILSLLGAGAVGLKGVNSQTLTRLLVRDALAQGNNPFAAALIGTPGALRQSLAPGSAGAANRLIGNPNE